MTFPGFDPTITAGNIIEIATIIGSFFLFLARMNKTVGTLETEVSLMQKEIIKIGDVLTKLAVADTRLNNLEFDVREMRHGNGFVTGPRGVDREYPGRE